jgi:hypothetical protein
MKLFLRPRLRKPVGIALLGTAFATAWLVRGGPTWFLAIVIEVTVLARAIGVYVYGAEDSDEGALAGSRPDERQKQLSLRARALAANAVVAAAFVGVTVAVAVRAAWWWPFAVILAIAGFGYLFGLSTYGVGEEGPADEANAGHETRFSASR